MATGSDDTGMGSGTEPVDLDPEVRHEVAQFARALPSMTYYEVLGVGDDATPAQLRDAFFQRSRRFHPDRFFRKRLGPYGELINEIYKRVVAAHDVLRDGELRRSYDRGLQRSAASPGSRPAPSAVPSVDLPDEATAPPPEDAAEPSREPARPAPRVPPRGPSLRTRRGLRGRAQLLRGLEAQLDRARAKAERRFEEALEHKERGSWERAAQLLRLALVFAPRERRYAEQLEEVLPRANALRAVGLRDEGQRMLEQGDHWKALELLGECVDLEPADARLADQVARLSLQLGELERGIELARRAVELDEPSVAFRKTLAQLLDASGDSEAARREYQRVWKADPLDPDAKAALGRA